MKYNRNPAVKCNVSSNKAETGTELSSRVHAEGAPDAGFDPCLTKRKKRRKKQYDSIVFLRTHLYDAFSLCFRVFLILFTEQNYQVFLALENINNGCENQIGRGETCAGD